MHFKPSTLTSNQLRREIICSHFIIVMTFFQHSSKFSRQFLRESFLFRAGESVGLLLPGEMLCCGVKNLFLKRFVSIVALKCEYNDF